MYYPPAYSYYSWPARSTRPHRLAPHETLELHELLASKNTQLFNQKRALAQIADPELKKIYMESIRLCENHIRELVGLLQH